MTVLTRRPVVLYTTLHRIEGDLPVPATARVSDRLNQAEHFLPVERAQVYGLDGRLLYERPVVLVNTRTVVILLERGEEAGLEGGDPWPES